MNELSPGDDSEFYDTHDDFPSQLLAELYLGGDFSPELADKFEESLDDPELLEQLVVSVQVRDAVRAAMDERLQPAVALRVATARTRFWKWVGGVTVAAACAAAMLFAILPNGGPTDLAKNEQAGAAPLNENAFAPVWVDLVDESDAAETSVAQRDSSQDELDDVDATDVPDWLYAAVSLPTEELDVLEPLGDTL